MQLWYCCKICGRSYQEPKRLINHKRDHPEEWRRYKSERRKLKSSRMRHFSSSSSMASASTLDGSMIFGVYNPDQDLDMDLDLDLELQQNGKEQENNNNNNNTSIINPNEDANNKNDDGSQSTHLLLNSTTARNDNIEEISSTSSVSALPTFHPLSPPLSPKDPDQGWNYNSENNNNSSSNNRKDKDDEEDNIMEDSTRTVSISVPIRDNNFSGSSSNKNSYYSRSIPTEVEMEVESKKIILHICDFQGCQKMYPLRIKLNKHRQDVHNIKKNHNNNNKHVQLQKEKPEDEKEEEKTNNVEEEEDFPSQQCPHCEKSYTSDIAFKAHVKLHMKHQDKTGKPQSGTTSKRRSTPNNKSSETLSFRTSRQWALLEKKIPESSTTSTTTTKTSTNKNENPTDNNNSNKSSVTKTRRKVKSRKRKIVKENQIDIKSSSRNNSSNNNSPRKRKKTVTQESSNHHGQFKEIGRMAVTPASSASSSSSNNKYRYSTRSPKSPLSNLNSRVKSRGGGGGGNVNGPKTPKSHKSNGNIGFCLRSARKWALDYSTPAAQQKRQRLRDEIIQTKGQKKREPVINPLIYKEILSNGKPVHICLVCKLDFRLLSEAKQHLKTHTEYLKAFQCFLCDRRFSEKSSLTRHQKQVHAEVQDPGPGAGSFLIHRPRKTTKRKPKPEEMDKMDKRNQNVVQEISTSTNNNNNITKPRKNYKKMFKCELCPFLPPFNDFKLRYLHQQTVHPSSQTKQEKMIV